MSTSAKFGIGIVVVLVAVLVQGTLLSLLGARINTTRSIPLGIYLKVNAPLGAGAYVTFCPPPVGVFQQALERRYIGAGFCPGGLGMMMKRVMATTGARIVLKKDGVWIDGRLLERSVPLAADGDGLPLPRYQADDYVLSELQLLLMGDASPYSFDSRYFGPIQRQQVKDVIVPVLTWGGAENVIAGEKHE